MGQGQNKIALSLVDLQPTAIVELFELYIDSVDKPNVVHRFHGGSIFQEKIKWQDKDYSPIPVESEGFEVTANGQLPRPKIRISNKDYFITELLLNNKDFQFAKIIRRRTFVKYLDDENFDGGNPWGQADSSAELSLDTYIISQKTAENRVFVEFELSSPLDLENFEVNARLLMSRYCSWYYRGNGCNYSGPPMETEYGKTLILNTNTSNKFVNDPSSMFTASAWQTGIPYSSGDAAFIENKNIILNPHPNDQNRNIQFAKIWYVAQKDHTSADSNHPDTNETFWLRDGCNKKLEGCKRRFQTNQTLFIPTAGFQITNNFVDFTHKGIYNSNNIASQATITGLNEYKPAVLVANGIISGFGGNTQDENWLSTNPIKYLQFTWPQTKKINRIDLYDSKYHNANFNNAAVLLYNNNALIQSGNINVLTNGNRTTTGFNPIDVNKVIISGINSTAVAGLAEVSIFESSTLCLYNDSFSSSGLYAKPDLHMATWVQFPNGILSTSQNLNIFHNVKNQSQYSGLNLYVSGDNSLVLDFATVEVSGATPKYIVKTKSISIPFTPTNFQPIHLETYGGHTNGANPTSFPEGVIKISNLSNSSEYTLKTSDPKNKFSGEFFLFKNPSYAGSTKNLFFGINDWQYETGANFKQYTNYQLTSNFKIGSTAIWTGRGGIDARKAFFNRDLIPGQDSQYANKVPRTYGETYNLVTNELFAWWDMDLNFSAPNYSVSASNDANQKIYLSGEYQSSIEESSTTQFAYADINYTQKTVDYLPFGGFPGTDKYGR